MAYKILKLAMVLILIGVGLSLLAPKLEDRDVTITYITGKIVTLSLAHETNRFTGEVTPLVLKHGCLYFEGDPYTIECGIKKFEYHDQ